MIVPRRGPQATRAPKPGQAIQFKITLRDISPPIWRRVVLPDTGTLGLLHDVIQVAMGWTNSHLHAFRFGRTYYTSQQASEMGEMDMENEEGVLLRDVAGRAKTKFHYEYDFGDSWLHEVVVEKLLPFEAQMKLPACLGGARACPPEDCGSIPGYEGILAALTAARKTPDQKELLEWLGGDYDPEHFDLEAVNRRLSRA